MTSFCVHFEKIGRGLLQEGKRREGEWAVWAKGGGMNRKCILLGSYELRETASYSNEGLVASTLFDLKLQIVTRYQL